MNKVACIYVGYLPVKWVSAVLETIQDLRHRGYIVEVLDGLRFTVPRVRTPGPLAAFLLGSSPPTLSKLFSEAGAAYTLIPSTRAIRGALVSESEDERIGLAADSSAESLRRVETRLDGPIGGLIRHRMRTLARRSLLACTTRFESDRPDLLVVLNGRQVDNVGALLAAEKSGVATEYVELGVTPKTLWLKPFSVFDRGAISKDFRQAKLAPQSLFQARAWLESRISGSPEQNQFASTWAAGQDTVNGVSRHSFEDCIVLFSSSPDEFSALNEDWSPGRFWSQADAFQQVAQVLGELGHKEIVVRLHPNLARKRPIQILDALWMAKKLQRSFGPGCKVISPLASIDSYKLIEGSQAIVGFASTVCLEAAYMKRRAILLRDSYFSGIVGVPVAPSSESFRGALNAKFDHTEAEQLRQAATEFIAYTFSSSKPMALSYDVVFPGFDKLSSWKVHFASIATFRGAWVVADRLYSLATFLLAKALIATLSRALNLKLIS